MASIYVIILYGFGRQWSIRSTVVQDCGQYTDNRRNHHTDIPFDYVCSILLSFQWCFETCLRGHAHCPLDWQMPLKTRLFKVQQRFLSESSKHCIIWLEINKLQLVICWTLVSWNSKGNCKNLHLLSALFKVLKATVERMNPVEPPKSEYNVVYQRPVLCIFD